MTALELLFDEELFFEGLRLKDLILCSVLLSFPSSSRSERTLLLRVLAGRICLPIFGFAILSPDPNLFKLLLIFAFISILVFARDFSGEFVLRSKIFKQEVGSDCLMLCNIDGLKVLVSLDSSLFAFIDLFLLLSPWLDRSRSLSYFDDNAEIKAFFCPNIVPENSGLFCSPARNAFGTLILFDDAEGEDL